MKITRLDFFYKCLSRPSCTDFFLITIVSKESYCIAETALETVRLKFGDLKDFIATR